QIAGSVQQHVRLKDALKNDVIVQLQERIESAARLISPSLRDISREWLFLAAEQYQLDSLTVLLYDNGSFIPYESTRPVLVGNPIPEEFMPARLLESFETVEAGNEDAYQFYAEYWNNLPALESGEEMWGFYRQPNREYLLAA